MKAYNNFFLLFCVISEVCFFFNVFLDMFVSSSESEAEASGCDSVGRDSDSLGYFKAADTSSSESDDMVCLCVVCVFT